MTRSTKVHLSDITLMLTMLGTAPGPFSSGGNCGRLLDRVVLLGICWPLTPTGPICCTPGWPYCWPNEAPDIPIY